MCCLLLFDKCLVSLLSYFFSNFFWKLGFYFKFLFETGEVGKNLRAMTPFGVRLFCRYVPNEAHWRQASQVSRHLIGSFIPKTTAHIIMAILLTVYSTRFFIFSVRWFVTYRLVLHYVMYTTSQLSFFLKCVTVSPKLKSISQWLAFLLLQFRSIETNWILKSCSHTHTHTQRLTVLVLCMWCISFVQYLIMKHTSTFFYYNSLVRQIDWQFWLEAN